MKNILQLCIVFICLLFSTPIFAQRDAGGTSGGGGGSTGGSNGQECIVQPPPIEFKRNNGQGTCGGDGQVRLSFSQRPTAIPSLIALQYTDGSIVGNLLFPVKGDASNLDKKGYVSYCLTGVNIDPAKKLVAVFHYESGCEDVFVQEY